MAVLKEPAMNALTLFKPVLWRIAAPCIYAALPITSWAGNPDLLLTNYPGSPPSISGGGDSLSPSTTPDGRFVLFASTAPNLVLSSSNTPLAFYSPPKLDLYLRDRTNHTTALVSANTAGSGGGNGDSLPVDISTNGQTVLFESAANDLIADDTNGFSDIFARDIASGKTLLVSVNTNGTVANRPSAQAAMTPDGRFVVFVSRATDLVLDDTNGISDVFVRDLQNGVTTLACPGAAGTASSGSSSPFITPDGRYVVFLSTATNLVPGVVTSGEVYVRDLAAGETRVASTKAHQVLAGTIVSYSHSISDDGNYVAFETSSNPTTGTGAIFRYSLQSGVLDLVSTNAIGIRSGYIAYRQFRNPEMSQDGRFIVFVEKTSNGSKVSLWDAQDASTTLVSETVDHAEPENSICEWPTISPDGSYVAFLSTATNLTTNVVAEGFHLYVRDRHTDSTCLIDTDAEGLGSPRDFLNAPNFAADGRFLVFDCTDFGLLPADNNNATDVFFSDLSSNTTELISERAPNAASASPPRADYGAVFAMSSNGRYVAFSTTARDLTTNCANTYRRVFVHDRLLNTNLLVSADTNGLDSAVGPSAEPLISSDGRYVAFASEANNLISSDTNQTRDVFVRDLQTGITLLVSTNRTGTGPGNGASSPLAMSINGNCVLFQSRANNLTPGVSSTSYDNLYWRDVNSSQTRLIVNNGFSAAAMTPDGRFVAYGKPGSGMYLWDSAVSNVVHSYATPALTSIAVSPDGTRAAGLNSRAVYAMDRVAQTTWLIATSSISGPLSHSRLQFSADGRLLVYNTTSAQVTGDENGACDIYLYDFQARTNLLISRRFDVESAANSGSDSPTISADGRFIAYRSTAGDLMPGGARGIANLYLYDLQSGTNTLLTPSSRGQGPANNVSSAPTFSADGQILVFLSWASDLLTNDFNQLGDLFVVKVASGNPTTVLRGEIVYTPSGSSRPTLAWDADPARNYRVEFKDDLSDPLWQNLDCVITFTGSRATATDQTPSTRQRFYRIVAF
jgi:Tol biopolymer transport system component